MNVRLRMYTYCYSNLGAISAKDLLILPECSCQSYSSPRILKSAEHPVNQPCKSCPVILILISVQPELTLVRSPWAPALVQQISEPNCATILPLMKINGFGSAITGSMLQLAIYFFSNSQDLHVVLINLCPLSAESIATFVHVLGQYHQQTGPTLRVLK